MKISELLNSPEKWTKGALARDKNDKYVGILSKDAASYCLLGALFYCYDNKCIGKKWNKLNNAILEYGFRCFGETVVAFNNHPKTTYEDVIEVVKLADL